MKKKKNYWKYLKTFFPDNTIIFLSPGHCMAVALEQLFTNPNRKVFVIHVNL